MARCLVIGCRGEHIVVVALTRDEILHHRFGGVEFRELLS